MRATRNCEGVLRAAVFLRGNTQKRRRVLPVVLRGRDKNAAARVSCVSPPVSGPGAFWRFENVERASVLPEVEEAASRKREPHRERRAV